MPEIDKAAEMAEHVGGDQRRDAIVSFIHQQPKQRRASLQRAVDSTDPALRKAAYRRMARLYQDDKAERAKERSERRRAADAIKIDESRVGLITDRDEYRSTLRAAARGDKAAQRKLINHRRARGL